MRPVTIPLLSKTSFMHFLECPIWLWLEKVRPELMPPHEEDVKRIMEQGRLVDDLARALYPDGVEVQGFNLLGFKNTQTAIAKGAKILYQPTAVADGITARADMLIKVGGKWDLHEVKSATTVKPEYISDLAFQRLCFERAGIPIGKTYVVHINNKYVRKGDVDPLRLLVEVDVTADVKDELAEVARRIPEAKEVLAWPKHLDAARMRSCANLGKCEYVGHWLNFLKPGPRETALKGIETAMVAKMLENEAVEIGGLSARFLDMIPYRTPEERWPSKLDKPAIRAAIGSLKYPLHFFDYETYYSAVPAFDGYRPYQQIPFQFSAYVIDTPGAKPRKYDFLMETFEDPSVKIIDALREAIGEKGSVLAWFATFEKGRNSELAKMHPKHAKFLLGINDRIYDPLYIFKKKLYVHPGFGGSASLKAVMPTLIPELSYKDLNIQEGGSASASWPVLTDPSVPKEKRKQLHKDMIAYCRLDVLGMVKILEHLSAVTRG